MAETWTRQSDTIGQKWVAYSVRTGGQEDGQGCWRADPPSSWHEDGAAAAELQKASPVSEQGIFSQTLSFSAELVEWGEVPGHRQLAADTQNPRTLTCTHKLKQHLHGRGLKPRRHEQFMSTRHVHSTAKSILMLVVLVFVPPAALRFLMVSFISPLFVLTCLMWSESVFFALGIQ